MKPGTRSLSVQTRVCARERARRLVARLLPSIGIATLVASALCGVAHAAPSITGAGTFTYEQGDPPVNIGDGLIVTGGAGYGGEFVAFEVGSSTSSEVLSLATDSSADTTAGAVSVVGGVVHLGNGTTTDVVGSIDSTDDGDAGRPLRVNFADEFVDAGFEDGLIGWTTEDQRVDLGVSSLAGCATVDTSTYPAPVPNADNNVPLLPGTRSVTAVMSGAAPEGAHVAQVAVNDMVTVDDFDVVHGPAIFSTPFDADAGDRVSFEWQGVEGDDDYHVFGYLVDSGCNQLEVLDATGAGTSAWTSSETTIAVAGTYRLVFVTGTYNQFGGHGAGATLLVDDVRIDGTAATDDVVQQIARKLHYENSSFSSATSRTVTMTAQSALSGTGFASITVDLELAPVIPPPGGQPPGGPSTDHGYIGVVPTRLWDSRSGAKPLAGSVRELVVVGQAGVPSDATAVVLNVTVDRPDGWGFVTVFPCGGELPVASNVNYVQDQTVANAVTVSVGAAGKVCVYTSTATHLIVDVSGAYSPSEGQGLLVPGIAPSRLWDSRDGAKPLAGSVRELVVLGQAGVPSDATAVVLNVTVDRPDGSGFVTVFPCGGDLPVASNVNYVQDQTVANAVTVAVGVVGRVCVYTSTATHLIVDVSGAYSPSQGTGSLVDEILPSRLSDSRLGLKPATGSVRELVVVAQGGVPSDATAVVLNVTVDRPEGWGFVTVFPCGGSPPLASNVNYVKDQTVANSVTVAVGLAGRVCFYVSTATHLVIDTNAAFAP